VFHYWESVNQGVILEDSGFRVMSHKYVTPTAKTGPAGGVVPIAPCVGGILLPGRQNEGPPQVPRNKIHRGRCGRLPYCWRAGTDCVGIPFCQAFRFSFRGLGETRTAVGSHPLEKEPHGGGPGLPRDSLILGTTMSPSPGLHGWRPYSFP
jgi:hypothetical protein